MTPISPETENNTMAGRFEWIVYCFSGIGIGGTSLVFVYEDPVEFVRRRAKALGDGQYRVMVLFLGTQFDEDFIREVESLGQDLDSLTGPYALAVLFTPPPPSLKDTLSGYMGFRALGRGYIESDWDKFIEAMTEGTYNVAKSLGVPFKDLPAVVFLDPNEDDPELVTWRLKDITFRDLYKELRSVFDDWYRENSEVMAKIKTLHIVEKFPWAKVPSKQPEMTMFHSFVKSTIIPKLLEAGNLSGVSGEVKRRIENLSRQPRNTEVVGLALQKSAKPLTVDGHGWTAATFSSDFFKFVRTEAGHERRTLLKSMKFPLRRLSSTTRKLAVRQLIDRVDLGSIEAEAGGLKFKYNPLSMLRHAFGIKDPA